MDKLTDPNPYDILGISPNADHRAIKQALAEIQRKKGRTQIERQEALNARNVLFSTEKRLRVDSLVPDFSDSSDGEDLQSALKQFIEPVDAVDWRDIANPDTIIAQDLQALIEATIRYTVGNAPAPNCNPTLLTVFDGLDDFLETWLH